MNNRRTTRWMMAVMLLVLSLALTGCYVTPDIQTGGNNNTGIGDFPTFAPATTPPIIPTDQPVTNPTGGITTPGFGGVVTLPTNSGGNTGWSPVVIPTVPIITQPTITTPPDTTGPTSTPAGPLKLGSQGEAVREVQRKLKTLKFYDGQADGDFGAGTEAAVKAFQEQYRLTADGVVGAATLQKLMEANATKRPDTTPTPDASAPLKLGSQGERVREVQRKLKSLGFYNGSVDGDFGESTQAAVIDFQKQFNLTADGIVGAGTLTKLMSANITQAPATSLKVGSQGTEVREVQQKLKSLGFYSGSVDGDFGEGTETAVKNFQRQYGLTADGKVGAQTLQALRSARNTARPGYQGAGNATPVPSYNENTYLRKGNSGSDVRKMQERLISLGYLSGNATGTFDDATEAGVTAFQKRHCSYSDGVAGPLTLKELYSSSARSTSTAAAIIGTTLQQGSEGAQVRSLQTQLKKLGYYTGTVDGSYGQGTVNAVKAFQKAHGLTADGKAGTATLNLLYSGNAKTAAQSRVTNTPRPTATRRPTSTPYRTATPLPEGTWVKVTPNPNAKYVTLRRGNYGDLVEKLQKELKNQGFYSGTADGYYGAGTESAVKSLQQRYKLNVDGVAGHATQRYLFEGNFPDGA